MSRNAYIPVALVLLMAAPAAQAGPLHELEVATKAAHDAQEAGAAAHTVEEAARVGGTTEKFENNVNGLSSSVEATGLKVETGIPGWVYLLGFVGVGAWLLWKFRARQRH